MTDTTADAILNLKETSASFKGMQEVPTVSALCFNLFLILVHVKYVKLTDDWVQRRS